MESTNSDSSFPPQQTISLRESNEFPFNHHKESMSYFNNMCTWIAQALQRQRAMDIVHFVQELLLKKGCLNFICLYKVAKPAEHIVFYTLLSHALTQYSTRLASSVSHYRSGFIDYLGDGGINATREIKIPKQKGFG